MRPDEPDVPSSVEEKAIAQPATGYGANVHEYHGKFLSLHIAMSLLHPCKVNFWDSILASTRICQPSTTAFDSLLVDIEILSRVFV
jgi:hypothetical protein